MTSSAGIRENETDSQKGEEMRPKAGHTWTVIWRGGREIHLIQNDAGQWITTGEAKDWRRCTRCRRPFEADPFDSGLCTTCYFYKSGLPVKEFWRLHNEGYYLAPYNIGRRCTKNLNSSFPTQDIQK
jgi:hypothetical protein